MEKGLEAEVGSTSIENQFNRKYYPFRELAGGGPTISQYLFSLGRRALDKARKSVYLLCCPKSNYDDWEF